MYVEWINSNLAWFICCWDNYGSLQASLPAHSFLGLLVHLGHSCHGGRICFLYMMPSVASCDPQSESQIHSDDFLEAWWLDPHGPLVPPLRLLPLHLLSLSLSLICTSCLKNFLHSPPLHGKLLHSLQNPAQTSHLLPASILLLSLPGLYSVLRSLGCISLIPWVFPLLEVLEGMDHVLSHLFPWVLGLVQGR